MLFVEVLNCRDLPREHGFGRHDNPFVRFDLGKFSGRASTARDARPFVRVKLLFQSDDEASANFVERNQREVKENVSEGTQDLREWLGGPVENTQKKEKKSSHRGYMRSETPVFPHTENPTWDPPVLCSLPGFDPTLAHDTGYLLRILVLCRDTVKSFTLPHQRLAVAYISADRIPLGHVKTVRVQLHMNDLDAGTIDLRVGIDPVGENLKADLEADRKIYFAPEVRAGDLPPISYVSAVLAPRTPKLSRQQDSEPMDMDLVTHEARGKNMSLMIKAPDAWGEEDVVGLVEYRRKGKKPINIEAVNVLLEVERECERLGLDTKKRTDLRKHEVIYSKKTVIDGTGSKTKSTELQRGSHIWPFVAPVPFLATEHEKPDGYRIVLYKVTMTAILVKESGDPEAVSISIQERPSEDSNVGAEAGDRNHRHRHRHVHHHRPPAIPLPPPDVSTDEASPATSSSKSDWGQLLAEDVQQLESLVPEYSAPVLATDNLDTV